MENLYSRRNFVKASATGVAGILLLSKCNSSENTHWHFFKENEALAIEAMCEQIIPTDYDPGAKEANVINFIDKQLVSNYSEFQETYQQGIKGLQETSQIMFGNVFENLKWDDQYKVLLSLESGNAKGKVWENESASNFFNLVRTHTMQGFYGDPKHGGNKNHMSYKMLKLDYPQIIGQNRYNHPKS